MSDFPPPPPPNIPPPPPPGLGGPPPPPGYVAYGEHVPVSHGAYAGFWIRFAAAVIDGITLGIPLQIVGAVTGLNSSPSFNLLSIAVGIAYFGTLEGGTTGQTLGKRVTGIRVVDAETGQPGVGFGRAVGRYFARWLSALVCLLGYLWMLWDGHKQTWHDKLVKTYVVKA